MQHPIPKEALDDRLAFVGTAGSGKTYNAGSCVERLLSSKARCVVIDPLGVWWGLRLKADGNSASAFDIPIFGGLHGDLALTEHAGALIGETVASMAESCILDLSQIGTKAGERRFMLAFLTALYRGVNGSPVHLIIDEADMWAPQRLMDKEGEAPKLLGMMETLVRRGRIKGFIPWLITQRPAVLSKNVLSQADGLVAFKLTSSQDRDAIGDWVEGQADKAEWRQIWASMPTLPRGTGLVWLPARGILKTEAFPAKATFDSSRTPKRGEKLHDTTLRPLDLGRLKERLSKVEAETKANDPKALKGEIAALKRQLAEKGPTLDPAELRGAYDNGLAEGLARGEGRAKQELKAVLEATDRLGGIAQAALERLNSPTPTPMPRRQVTAPPVAPRPVRSSSAIGNGVSELSGALQKIIDAIRWWNVLGVATPSHPQVGFIAGYSHKSGTWATYLSRLRSMGMIEGRGDLVLTNEGASHANDPDTPPSGEELRSTVLEKVDGPLAKILTPIIAAYPRGLSHQDAAEEAGYSHQSGTWATYLSRLRSLELIDGRGELKAQDWMFP